MNSNSINKNQSNGGLGELHPKEIELLLKLREKYRFGEVVLIMHDGLAKRIKKTVEYEEV